MTEIEFIVPMKDEAGNTTRLRKKSPNTFPCIPRPGDDVCLTEGGGVTLSVAAVSWESDGSVHLLMKPMDTSEEGALVEQLSNDGFA